MKFILCVLLLTLSFSQKKKNVWKVDSNLVAERDFKMTTDEGTWISLDVSPNGKQIVFDILGDIYIMPSRGEMGVGLGPVGGIR